MNRVLVKCMILLGCPMLLLNCSLLQANEGANSKREMQALMGLWSLEEFVSDGRAAVNHSIYTLEWLFERDKFVVRTSEKVVSEFEYTLNAEKSPKEFDARYIGKDREKATVYREPVRGIYSIEGDRLIRCIAAPGGPRPTSFESKAGSGIQLYIHRRK